MKLKILVGAVALILSATSCKKEDVKQMENIEAQITSGSWRISYFNDSGVNETANFNSYNFTFNGDGTLTASNGSNTYSGTWSVSDSNSNDDSTDDLDFNIYFNLTNDFEDLNDDWDIISHSSLELKLNDVSGGNGGTDELTFVKN
jgi:hypothetical protein